MKIWHEVWDYVKMIIIVVAVVLVVNNVVLINAKIPSESMEKTIMTGDRIFGFRLAYGINPILFPTTAILCWETTETTPRIPVSGPTPSCGLTRSWEKRL